DFKGYAIKGSKAAVSVEETECSNTGVKILKMGGNAVDAAIASTLCIGVINAFATGKGGFMLIRSPNGTFEFIDFRETAPKASHKDMFSHDPKLAQIGGLSVGVPGEIRGLELAHKRHGKLPWPVLFEPAIRLSRDGFETPALLERKLKAAESWMKDLPEWTDVYFKNGSPAKKGAIIKREKLADTLEAISRQGADVFYDGEITEHLVKTAQENGGIITLQDFKEYQAVIRPVVSTYYNGRKVTTCSEPTSGPVLLSILNLIERYQFKAQGYVEESVHRLTEAYKFGFAFRTEFGDPDFIHNEDRIKEIISKDFAAKKRQLINDMTHGPLYYNPKFDHIQSHGTMHLSIVDEHDGAVALTSTVNLNFGSHVLDEKTGVILNDEMDDFSIPGIPNEFNLYPSKYNYAEPGKRPLSSITPVIIEKDSAFEIAIGGSGGSRIISATLNVIFIINMLDYGKNIYDAIAFPRIHHQLLPNVINAEHGFSREIAKKLRLRGHEVVIKEKEWSTTAVQGVRRLADGTVEAASDPRKMGFAAAY
ncbi:gamma-glutamyltransferase, partial [Backusella circina FSU 941]